MAKRNIGATLSLNNGNFFTNIKSAITGTNNLKTATTSATGSLKKMGSQGNAAGQSLTSLAKKAVGVVAAYAGFKQVTAFMTDCVTGVMELERANTRLETLMMNVKGTTKDQVQEIIKYGDALELVTTIEGDATVAGASQLATFQLNANTIKTIMPAFQDLAVAQYGVNVTQDQMIQSGNLIGKVMMGSVGALTKAGVSFTKTQENILKTGTESQKAATLVEVLGANFGGLAKQMAQTPEGRIRQLKNAWGSVKDEIGFAVLPIISKVVSFTATNIPQMRDTVTNAIESIKSPFMAVKNFVVDAFNNIKTAVGENAGKFEALKNIILGISFTSFENAKPILNWIKDTALPGVVGIMGNFADVIKAVSDNWNVLGPIVYGVAGAIVAYNIAVGLNNALITYASIVSGQKATALAGLSIAQLFNIAVTGTATAVTTAFGAAMAFVCSPIFLVVAAIGVAIAIGILLYKNWDSVCKGISIAWEWVKQTAMNIWNGICDFFIAYWPYILGIFTGGVGLIIGLVIQNWDTVKSTTISVFTSIKETLLNIWNGIVNGIKGCINVIISAINGMIGGINKLQFDVPSWVPVIGGMQWGFNIPQIPMLAQGGIIQKPGSVLVGEKGAEILNLPSGASVTPLNKTTKNENHITINVYADGKSSEEIVNEVVPKLKLALANL